MRSAFDAWALCWICAPTKLPSSTTALPGAGDDGSSYGKLPGDVVGASGSFAERTSAKTRRASASPSRASSASRNIEFRTSRPPFAPNRAAMSAADATTSLAVNGVAGIPRARYQALTPAA